MSQNSDDLVRIFGVSDDVVEGEDQELGWWSKRPDEIEYGRADVPVDLLRQRIDRFLKQMQGIFLNIPKTFGQFELDKVTLSVEVSAKGGISLLGNGGEVGGSGGLQFELTRIRKQDSDSTTPGGVSGHQVAAAGTNITDQNAASDPPVVLVAEGQDK